MATRALLRLGKCFLPRPGNVAARQGLGEALSGPEQAESGGGMVCPRRFMDAQDSYDLPLPDDEIVTIDVREIFVLPPYSSLYILLERGLWKGHSFVV